MSHAAFATKQLWMAKLTEKLKILHCLRAPVGGLFRHVRDLSAAQSELGHAVGIVVDSTAKDQLTARRLEEIRPHLALGIHRIPIPRRPGPKDILAVRATQKVAKDLSADILHGHGAKGGACARLAGWTLRNRGQVVKTFYTPHGGSLHYSPKTPQGLVFSNLEKVLARSTDGLIFESEFAKRTYENSIGQAIAPTRVIPNGLDPKEFDIVTPSDTASDFLFIGELRKLKGVDILLNALAQHAPLQNMTCTIVGDGPDKAEFEEQTQRLGLKNRITFTGAMPAREAFQLGRTMVMPSRQESLPYIILEAAAAAVPVIATNVGGIPEIFADQQSRLVAPNDPAALASKMENHLKFPEQAAKDAHDLRAVIENRFTITNMSRAILLFYKSSAPN